MYKLTAVYNLSRYNCVGEFIPCYCVNYGAITFTAKSPYELLMYIARFMTNQ